MNSLKIKLIVINNKYIFFAITLLTIKIFSIFLLRPTFNCFEFLSFDITFIKQWRLLNFQLILKTYYSRLKVIYIAQLCYFIRWYVLNQIWFPTFIYLSFKLFICHLLNRLAIKVKMEKILIILGMIIN